MAGTFSCVYNGIPFTADTDAFYDHSPSSDYYNLSYYKFEDGTTDVFLTGMDKSNFEIYFWNFFRLLNKLQNPCNFYGNFCRLRIYEFCYRTFSIGSFVE